MSTSTPELIFKVSYLDHSKHYVAKVSASEKYRSYLSLMPEGEDEGNGGEDDPAEVEKGKRILSEFTALSYEEQKGLRLR